jgi:hypothetical protein
LRNLLQPARAGIRKFVSWLALDFAILSKLRILLNTEIGGMAFFPPINPSEGFAGIVEC